MVMATADCHVASRTMKLRGFVNRLLDDSSATAVMPMTASIISAINDARTDKVMRVAVSPCRRVAASSRFTAIRTISQQATSAMAAERNIGNSTAAAVTTSAPVVKKRAALSILKRNNAGAA